MSKSLKFKFFTIFLITFVAIYIISCNSSPITDNETPGPEDKIPESEFNLRNAGNTRPIGIWSDGTTMWVSDYVDEKIYAYDMVIKSRNANKDFNTLPNSGNGAPAGIWSDGTTMWVADDSDNKIYAYNLASKARDASKDFNTLSDAGNTYPISLWSDGSTMWVSDFDDKKIYAYNLVTKDRDASKDFSDIKIGTDSHSRITGIWSDGTTMWVTSSLDGKIYAYNMSSKVRDGSRYFINLGLLQPTRPYDIWSDGTTMWIVDSFENKILSYSNYNIPIPIAPTSLIAQSDNSKINISWDRVANAESYTIYWTTLSGHGRKGNQITGVTSPYQHSGINNGTTYYYVITATNTAGESSISEEVSATPKPVPPAPINVIAQSGNNQITISWDIVTNAESYTIYWSTTSGQGKKGNQITRVTPPYQHTGLVSAGSYYYVVTASNAAGESLMSVEVHARNENQSLTDLAAAGNTYPQGLWSDGTTLWVADAWNPKIYAYNLASKARDASKDFNTLNNADNKSPAGLWSDGTTMWVADDSDDKIYAYNLASKARDSSKDFSLSRESFDQNLYPYGIWSDGDTMWVANYSDYKIFAYNMTTKERDSSKDFAKSTLQAAGNKWPRGIWSDGTTMWVVNYGAGDDNVAGKIYAYNLDSKARDSSKDINLDLANSFAKGLWSDGVYLWVANSFSGFGAGESGKPKIYTYRFNQKVSDSK